MKKKIVSLCLVIALLAIAVVGGTLAYFTDKDENTNTFTMGKVDIVLDEADVEYDEKDHVWYALNDDDDERVQKNEYGQVYPGAILPKDPTVHNVGDYDAYIRATINVSNWMNVCAALYDDVDPMSADSLLCLVEALGEGWSVIDVIPGDTFEFGNAFDTKYVLEYAGVLPAGVLPAGESTTPIFEFLTIPAEMESGADYMLEEMKIVAYAIQSDGFTVNEEVTNQDEDGNILDEDGEIIFWVNNDGDYFKDAGLTIPADYDTEVEPKFEYKTVTAKEAAWEAFGELN